jgi:hypothetical protein
VLLPAAASPPPTYAPFAALIQLIPREQTIACVSRISGSGRGRVKTHWLGWFGWLKEAEANAVQW